MQIIDGVIYLDNTMVNSYRECPRKFFLRHVLGWRKTGIAAPLVFGLSWHEAMNTLWAASSTGERDTTALVDLAYTSFEDCWVKEGMKAQTDMTVDEVAYLGARIPAIGKEMLYGYIEAREDILQRSELLAVEQPFAVPLDESGHVTYIGRLDKVVRYNGERLPIEHKTTTSYKKDGGFQTSYLDSWSMDSQTAGYNFGGYLTYGDVRQVWVDAALVHRTVHNAFRFIPVSHQHELMDSWLLDTRQWSDRCLQEVEGWNANSETYRGKAQLPCFPKALNSCYGKFGACGFVDLCRTIANPASLEEVPAGYIVEPWEPFTLHYGDDE